MITLSRFVESHAKVIAAVQALVIVFFLSACLLHDVIPVCHYLFGCDHRLH